jgi:hypothetical protein
MQATWRQIIKKLPAHAQYIAMNNFERGVLFAGMGARAIATTAGIFALVESPIKYKELRDKNPPIENEPNAVAITRCVTGVVRSTTFSAAMGGAIGAGLGFFVGAAPITVPLACAVSLYLEKDSEPKTPAP